MLFLLIETIIQAVLYLKGHYLEKRYLYRTTIAVILRILDGKPKLNTHTTKTMKRVHDACRGVSNHEFSNKFYQKRHRNRMTKKTPGFSEQLELLKKCDKLQGEIKNVIFSKRVNEVKNKACRDYNHRLEEIENLIQVKQLNIFIRKQAWIDKEKERIEKRVLQLVESQTEPEMPPDFPEFFHSITDESKWEDFDKSVLHFNNPLIYKLRNPEPERKALIDTYLQEEY